MERIVIAMPRAAVVLAMLIGGLLIAGCRKPHRARSTAGGSARAPALAKVERQGRLAFTILAIHRNQIPLSAPPWHADASGTAGAWTFFDARTRAGIAFGFGLRDVTLARDEKSAFSKAMLTVPDAPSGARLAEAFSKAFRGQLPEAGPARPLRLRPFDAAVLAAGAKRTPSGFVSGGGTWTATKLFVECDELFAEVFFNFDLSQKRGDFREKEPRDANNLVAVVARALRDGRRPARTPATDPQIVANGPTVASWQPLVLGAVDYHEFAGHDRCVVGVREGEGSRLVSVSLDNPSDTRVVAELDHVATKLHCFRDEGPCVIDEATPAKRGTRKDAEPRRRYLIDKPGGEKRPIDGAWSASAYVPLLAWAPDASYFVVADWKPKPNEKASYRVSYFVPRGAGEWTTFDAVGEDSDVMAWRGAGAALRAVVRIGNPWGPAANPRYVLLDPRTGLRSDAVGFSPPKQEYGLSPDRKHRVECRDNEEVIVTEVASHTSKSFRIHEDDRVFLDEEDDCAAWRGNRQLQLLVPRTAFIDIDTMKMSYAFGEDDEPQRLELSDDFRWALSTRDDGLYVGRITQK